MNAALAMLAKEPVSAVPDTSHPHVDVLGVKVSAVNMSGAVEIAERWIARGRPGYMCLTGVHGVMEAHANLQFRRILNSAVLNAPDGMPLSWIGHWQGHREMDRVFGPDFMAAMCGISVALGYRHFLYGGEAGVAESLQSVLEKRFPGLKIVGTYTPPFRELNRSEEAELLTRIRTSSPHIMWIGLSTPKQERFMAAWRERLQVPLLVGVGAAFDFHTGRIQDSPRWIKRAGLQWLHRLIQDPRRLARRYWRTHPAFLWQMALHRANRGSLANQEPNHCAATTGSEM